VRDIGIRILNGVSKLLSYSSALSSRCQEFFLYLWYYRRAMGFGHYLRDLRVHAGLTQSQLARKCRLTSAYITQLEKGKTGPPSRGVCQALARALGVEGRDLRRYAFAERLERWARKEGYKRIPDRLTSIFFDTLDPPRHHGLAASTESERRKP
jgi:transcriptional regulator with XRE-family HTH domain